MNRLRQVYFARCIGPHKTPMGAIKIGCSYGHELRLQSIARNQPFTLELITAVPGEMVTEAMVHLYLSRHRIDGEFFHENQVVMRYVEQVAARGAAFHYIEDAGNADHLPAKALEAFMRYHGISLDEVARYLQRDLKHLVGKLEGVRNRNIVAATAILAQTDGRYVSWPRDCIFGLLGEVHPSIRPALPAPEREAA